MNDLNLYEFLKDVKAIKENTKYWLVRTMGGDFYEEFVKDEFIAIGYNEITIDDLNHLPQKEKQAKKILQEMLKVRRENLRNVGYPASQILRFAREMQEGDIVIVPASLSYKVTFGIVKSELYQLDKRTYIEGRCPFVKRRNIEWVKTSMRYALPAELQLMFSSRHIISEVDSYASYIDSFLNDFYTKDDITYLVLRVKQEEVLSADDFTLVSDLMTLFNSYSEEYHLGITSQDIKMKISVQSPGDILVFAQSWEGIVVIGLMILFIKGGVFNVNCGEFKLGAKSPTLGNTIGKLISAVNEFLNDKKKREIMDKLSKKLDNMNIETPAPLIELMKELGENKKDKDDKEDEMD